MVKTKHIFLMVSCWLLALSGYSQVGADTLGVGSWERLETSHATIEYQNPEDLKAFGKKLNYRAQNWFLGLLSNQSKSRKLSDEIGIKVDGIFERVQELLQMKKDMGKVLVKIYSNKDKLKTAYAGIAGSSVRCYDDHCVKEFSSPRAWYIYESNTIYINIDDFHQGILAHEMAHAVIDHFLGRRPDRDAAETLAQHVEKNLLF